jgi:hypothetical protein
MLFHVAVSYLFYLGVDDVEFSCFDVVLSRLSV